eukprot:CAMPEP_0182898588 /NCGR_PEP_ID=MMETSP0034_2-20130328/27573_1 /TAXON_ID=156128 /ORGANISM="Nephroselmis pyriformis, Strain CCMP717" /LENGTH=297 /DNA_ID=CAMNT_0025032569 /DNA_START=306 /DNA_END=1199 /DNA_ORIENTATION=-
MRSSGNRSMFGYQADSKKTSSAQFGFGSETRFETTDTLFHSQRHTRANLAKGSPGPIYNPGLDKVKHASPAYAFGSRTVVARQRLDVPGPGAYRGVSSLGAQKSSRSHTSPSYGFGKGDRDSINHKTFISDRHIRNTGGTAAQAPGAGTYDIHGSIGRQALSPKRTAGSSMWSGMSTVRLQSGASEKWSAKVPGPGAYETILPAIGKQASSKRPSEPAIGFGTSVRDVRGIRQFVSTRHLRELIGEFSPGPMLVGPFSSLGKQAASKKKNLPAYGFARSQRFTNKVSGVPGPGSYDN